MVDIFQFTPLREGRPAMCLDRSFMLSLFQFTPLREGRRQSSGAMSMTQIDFNSRPSARGDTNWGGKAMNKLFQFTPLREGRHAHLDNGLFGENISIHAPPRGATGFDVLCGNAQLFQFTPLREGRHVAAFSVVKLFYFNSRPSARGDGRKPVIYKKQDIISIHAPPRGATRPAVPTTASTGISIHAPPRGATNRPHRPAQG